MELEQRTAEILNLHQEGAEKLGVLKAEMQIISFSCPKHDSWQAVSWEVEQIMAACNQMRNCLVPDLQKVVDEAYFKRLQEAFNGEHGKRITPQTDNVLMDLS